MTPNDSSAALKSVFIEFLKMQGVIEATYQSYLPPGISVLQAHILVALHNCPGIMAHELAGLVGRSATGFTPILDVLENHGLIVRGAYKTDRRAITLHLTEQGEAFFPSLADQLTTAHLSAATLMRVLAGKAATEQGRE